MSSSYVAFGRTPRTAAVIEAEISQLVIYFRAVKWLLVVSSVASLSVVVTTTVNGPLYSPLALTLWCGIPVLYLIFAAGTVLAAREQLLRGIHDRQVQLHQLAEHSQEATR